MMPVIFIGHGSPMNAIEENEFTKGWQDIAAFIPKPSAILAISAHWQTNGTLVSTLDNPKTIYDFYGFPKALFDVKYKVKGSPAFALKTLELLGEAARADQSWGIDHGTWSVLNVMYPNADIPVYQMSIDEHATPSELFELGRKLSSLRDSNVLILGSGNIVHNLRILDFSTNGGFEWANTFDNYIKDKILQRDFERIFDYQILGDIANYAVPTTEHFSPLFYILGASNSTDKITIYNNSCTAGSISMTSYVFS